MRRCPPSSPGAPSRPYAVPSDRAGPLQRASAVAGFLGADAPAVQRGAGRERSSRITAAIRVSTPSLA